MARRPSLKSLSLDQLTALRNEVQAALSARIEAERMELRKRIEVLADLEKGTPGGDARPTRKEAPKRQARSRKPSPQKSIKVVPKYRGPNGETWSGRGLPPRWLAALEAQGRTRDSFLIKAEK